MQTAFWQIDYSQLELLLLRVQSGVATGLECDAVLQTWDGSYALVEIKLGGETLIEEGASSLNKLADLICAKKMSAPRFKMVLTAKGAFAYTRPDGVIVCPLGCLRD